MEASPQITLLTLGENLDINLLRAKHIPTWGSKYVLHLVSNIDGSCLSLDGGKAEGRNDAVFSSELNECMNQQ